MTQEEGSSGSSVAPYTLPFRTALLARYDVLDTPREAEFDDIARLAAAICEAPIAVVNFLADDRQWFMGEVGLGVRETPLETSFCAHAILEHEFLEVPDATVDPRFKRNPLVTIEGGIRFYAGVLLKTEDDVAIGTLCVLDTIARPKGLTDLQRFTLRTLATQVMAQLELRRTAKLEHETRGDLENSRARFEAIYNSAVDYAIIVTDLDGRVTDWNDGATRILGWTPNEICGRDLTAFFTPEDREAGIPQAEVARALANGRAGDERWHLRKSGERFWASGEMMPLRDAGGDPVGFVKVVRDRTKARLAEERLAASEKRWRELFETMREGFFVAELLRDEAGRAVDYRFLEINEAFAEQSGLPKSSVGRTIRDFAPNIEQWLIDGFALTVETGEPQISQIHVPDLHRWFEVRSAKADGERFSCLFLDITARKANEEQLALKDERLQMALAASGVVGLWDWMVDTDLLHGDDNFARLYGLDVDHAAAGLTMEEYQEHVVPEDIGPLRESIRGVFDRGEDFLVEYRLAIPGQPLRWVECKGRMIPDGEGRPLRFSGTAIEITARKTAEEQKQLLMEELSHRVKNTFAMVQALVSQTMRGSDPAALETLRSRLAALSGAHEILLQRHWESTTITDLLRRVLRLEAEGGRFMLSGPNFRVEPEAALSLSLLLHELATNATKYGALSNGVGRVHVGWRFEGERFRLFWDEEGGPPAKPPHQTSFGSKLIAMGIRGNRNAKLDYAADGLHATFEVDRSLVHSEARLGRESDE